MAQQGVEPNDAVQNWTPLKGRDKLRVLHSITDGKGIDTFQLGLLAGFSVLGALIWSALTSVAFIAALIVMVFASLRGAVMLDLLDTSYKELKTWIQDEIKGLYAKTLIINGRRVKAPPKIRISADTYVRRHESRKEGA